MLVQVNVDMEGIPVYLRGGSIIPRKERARRSTAQMTGDPFTLWVALNETGSAQGDLYIDDGRSFAFQKGSYLYRHFAFDKGVLTNTPAQTELSPVSYQHSKMSVPNTIERIAILGLKQPASSYKALFKGALGQNLEVESGPLSNQPGVPDSALVIRKPNLSVGSNWSVQLISESAEL